MSFLKNLTNRSLFPNLLSCTKRFTSSVTGNTQGSTAEDDGEAIPPIIDRELKLLPKYTKPREVWVENFDKIKEEKRGLIRLHPEIFATIPRLDIVYDNVRWQQLYKKVTFHQAPSRAECRGGGRKPWPQKGMGKARHGSIRAPQWKNGGSCHGPRNPTSYFFRLPYQKKLMGLTSTLTVKFAQDDIKVVDNINIPTEDGSFLTDLMEERHWGLSVLIVDVKDLMPRNLTIASENLPFITYMPVYGLNVYSMLKHQTLVLTVDAVNEIENKLLKLLHTNDEKMCFKKYTMFMEGLGMPI